VFSCDEMALREILLLEQFWAKAYTDGCYFNIVPNENNLKIKNKPNPENFELCIYTMKLSVGLPIS
jgi:hypothetical protein